MVNQLTAGSSIDPWPETILPEPETTISAVATLRADEVSPTTVVTETDERQSEIRELIKLIGEIYDAPADLALAIARCESQYSQFADSGRVLRGRKNPNDVGVFQINEDYHLVASKKLGFDIHTIEGNIAYAMWLLKRDGSKPWRASQPCWGQIAKS
ncbi:MAG: hypothetical protein AAB468_01630 [Patescibacteria group bacterium]